MDTKLTVLVADPDSSYRDLLAKWLHEEGHEAILSDDSLAGLRQLFYHHPDAVILDVGSTTSNGWVVAQRIRELSNIPVILVSVRADRVSLKKAFDLGADGYIVKPFHRAEVIGRLAAVVARLQGSNGNHASVFRQDDLTIDWRRQEVYVGDRWIHLSATEFKLLTLLVQKRGWVLTHDQILSQVWGSSYIGERNNLKLYIWYLRHKIEPDPAHPRRILTKRGVGYTFADRQVSGNGAKDGRGHASGTPAEPPPGWETLRRYD